MGCVSDWVYIETVIYKVFSGHVVGDWGDVSKFSAVIIGATCPSCAHVWIKQETGGAWNSWI